MAKMGGRVFAALLLLAVAVNLSQSAMSDKQIKAAAKLVRNVCQPKMKVTDEQIDDMHNGKWDDVKEIKCYMNCCLTMLKVSRKDGSVDKDAAAAAMQQLPDDKKAKSLASLENCKDETGPDKCASSWNFAKCTYFDNPGNYFFP